MTEDRWARSTPALTASGSGSPDETSAPVLTEQQISDWRERGFALVDGVLPADLLARAEAVAQRSFPEPGSTSGEEVHDFGSQGRMSFPAEDAAVNEITLDPRLLTSVSQLLGDRRCDLRLTQSDLWAKYGRVTRAGGERDNQDQRIHVDYPNHTLTHPPHWDDPEAVEIIVYLTDVETCGGATTLVPRRGADDPAYPWPIVATPGVGELRWINDRVAAETYLHEHAPEIAAWRAEHLYGREVRARHRVGTVLFYRHDTWHRGTPLDPGARRFTQNLTFRRAQSEWISTLQPGWAWGMYRRSQVMERLVATASVDQRCVLGFPAPGEVYWTADTLDAVEARYGALGMDMTPYRRLREQRV